MHREEAHRLFSQSPFFAAWDPEVLDIYVECGLYTPSNAQGQNEARLKMPGYQEAVVFGERRVGQEVFEMLPGLDERIPIRWIVAGTNAIT